MDKRFTMFMILAVAIVVANQVIVTLLFPPPPQPAVAPEKQAKVAKVERDQAGDAAEEAKAAAAKVEPAPPPAEPAPDAPKQDVAAEQPATIESKRGSLGSCDAQSPFRMLVTWNNRGATIERVELNGSRYHNLENRSGFLGYLAPADAEGKAGALVRVVGPGTPAAVAGMQPGDVITAVSSEKITSATELTTALDATRPDEQVKITIRRDGNERQLAIDLRRHPLAVIAAEYDSQLVETVEPGNHDPLSFLMTIGQFDDRTLGASDEELGGLDLRHSEWEIVTSTDSAVSFRAVVPKLGLRLTKTYRLEKVPEDRQHDANYPAYSLLLNVSVQNIGDKKHSVSYRLDGPTGLPIEGTWYANKISRTWGGAGLRDIVARFKGGNPTQVGAGRIEHTDFKQVWVNTPLEYIAVDAQYFAAAVIPEKPNPADEWFSEVKPIRVGEVAKDKRLTNVSFRLDSTAEDLAPGGEPLASFQVFIGPKRPPLLDHYGPPDSTITLNDLVYYGWFGVVAQPMLAILHVFHRLVGNYGVAIIMLTVLVRGLMFPLSRKQAASAAKMAELQPEIKKLTEKYKNDPQKKTQAQQQLFREHNYNPLGGCLLALVQVPIFVGLYSSLKTDVELRQAPLFGENIRWASNLAAPDMFWNWSHVVPDFVSHGTGFFGLGPYLNILPLITIGLFIWQQKMFLPPPADEQAALQQKMMQYMMIFMGIMFFKVPSGLCVYFIASSIWGIVERKMLGKNKPQPATGLTASSSTTGVAGNGAPASKRRQRGRNK